MMLRNRNDVNGSLLSRLIILLRTKSTLNEQHFDELYSNVIAKVSKTFSFLSIGSNFRTSPAKNVDD